ncbi:MAG TPA: thioredoxin domain-containing protein [Rugosimonospora sp.]
MSFQINGSSGFGDAPGDLVTEEEQPGQRERERRRARRSVAILAVIALLLAGVAGWHAYEQQRPEGFPVPVHATSDGNGIVISSGKIRVDVYVDFNCQRCKDFESTAGNAIDQLLAARTVALTYHPIAILDQSSNPPGYSTQAAAASACAADGGKFLDYVKALFALQPAENGPGLSDDQLVQIGAWVGLINPEFAHCVRHGEYRKWVTHSTDVATAKGVSGTPTVLVASRTLPAPAADTLLEAVDAAKR